MRLILHFVVNALIVSLFLYSKLSPHKNRLSGRYLKTFIFFESIFNPILSFLKNMVKPAQVGAGIAVDTSQILLLLFLLITLELIL